MTLAVVPAATALAEGAEMLGAHAAPSWVTVKVSFPIVRVPVRLVEPTLAATLNVTAPDPEPAAPALIVIQGALLVAVQLQPVVAVTVLVPVTPAAGTHWDVGEMLGGHAMPNANVLDRALALLPPGPTAATCAS